MSATAARITASVTTFQFLALLLAGAVLAALTGLALEHLLGGGAPHHAQVMAWGRNGG